MTQDLNGLDIYQLIDLYNKEFGKHHTVKYWARKFGIDLTKYNNAKATPPKVNEVK